MRVALVHDHLNQIGGAERVLRSFHDIWPAAPIYTLAHDSEAIGDFFGNAKIITSFIQRLPLTKTHFRWYLSFMPAAIENFDLSGYDIILSSASAFAKGVIAPPNAVHICYCHTPTRYLWSDTGTYLDSVAKSGLIGRVLPLVLSRLRMWDQLAAQRVDYFIANSKFIAERIKRYYRRESTIIYPPVRVTGYPEAERKGYYIIVSRLRPYKKVDLAIRAFNRMNLPLVVVGDGEERERLEKIAGPNITFVGAVSDQEKRELLAGAAGFIHPQEEDFGIAQVEAMAAGTPVIAYDAGGARETIEPGVTGVFFEEQTWQSLADAVIRFRRQTFDHQLIKQSAQKFSEERFAKEIKEFVERIHRERKEEPASAEATAGRPKTYAHRG